MIELVLKGFDGGTDKTDDKIIWIGVPDEAIVTLNNNNSNSIESISELKVFPTSLDLTIELKEEKQMFMNYYRCPICKHEWEDQWDATCNDKCPNCNKEIEPYKWENI